MDKVGDVLGLHLAPPKNAPVLTVDEKSRVQAIDRAAPILPTTLARMTHDYVRHGTTSLFAAFAIGSGSVITQHYRRHRHQDIPAVLTLIDALVLKGLDLHLVLTTTQLARRPRSSNG